MYLCICIYIYIYNYIKENAGLTHRKMKAGPIKLIDDDKTIGNPNKLWKVPNQSQPLRQCLRVHMPLHYSYPNHSGMLSRLLLPYVLDNTWHINTSAEKIDHKLPALIEILHHIQIVDDNLHVPLL